MSTPFRLQIPRRLYDEMISQAFAELPNECCGILAGLVESLGTSRMIERNEGIGEIPIIRVERRLPLVNAAASPREFLSDAQSLFDATREMRRLGLEIVAVYHSHPMSPPVPSRTDLERNYSSEVMNLIISLWEGVPLVRAWWLTGDGYHPADYETVE